MKTIKAKYYLIPVAISLVVIVGLVYYYFLTDVAKEDKVSYLYIDDDDTADSVYVKLEPFATYHGLTGVKYLGRYWGYAGNIRTGRYAIQPGESAFTVLRKLKNGHQQAEMLTIPESRTMEKLAGVLARKLMLDSLTLATSLTDNDFCGRWGYDTATIACLFVPNTYEIYWNISLDGFMERMQKEHDHFCNGERTAKAEAIGLVPDEVCTLASIIDEETANNEEKPMVAGMYLNRLHAGMPFRQTPPSNSP